MVRGFTIHWGWIVILIITLRSFSEYSSMANQDVFSPQPHSHQFQISRKRPYPEANGPRCLKIRSLNSSNKRHISPHTQSYKKKTKTKQGAIKPVLGPFESAATEITVSVFETKNSRAIISWVFSARSGSADVGEIGTESQPCWGVNSCSTSVYGFLPS